MRRYCNLIIGLAMLASLLAGSSILAQSKQDDVAVIVNPQNQIESISSTDLRKIFAGEKRSWNSNIPVFVVVRAPQAHERDILLSHVLRMTESEYKQYWVKKVYSGEVPREPLALLSNGMQLEAVRADKGGIALINLADVKQGVKVLKVDGKLPGAPAYTLR